MKGTTIRTGMPYLDISDYLLKEHSPCFRPQVPDHYQVASPLSLTPQFSPILDGLNALIKTPLRKAIKEIGHSVFLTEDLDDFHEFSLEGGNFLKNENKSKKIKKAGLRPRLYSTWHFVDDQMEMIIRQNEEQSQMAESFNGQEEISEEEIEEQLVIGSCSEDMDDKQYQEEKQSTTNFDLVLNQEPLLLEWYNPNPKKQLINKLKLVCQNDQLKNQEEKMEGIKSTISKYIFDHQKYYFEESLNQLSGNISSVLNILTQGIDQTFRKNIGGLSFENRRIKLAKYMEKKKRRVWRKKVNYDCRKKVADGRLRIKGKFVTYEQAREQLGVNSLDGYNADEIRIMLQKKYDS